MGFAFNVETSPRRKMASAPQKRPLKPLRRSHKEASCFSTPTARTPRCNLTWARSVWNPSPSTSRGSTVTGRIQSTRYVQTLEVEQVDVKLDETIFARPQE